MTKLDKFLVHKPGCPANLHGYNDLKGKPLYKIEACNCGLKEARGEYKQLKEFARNYYILRVALEGAQNEIAILPHDTDTEE